MAPSAAGTTTTPQEKLATVGNPTSHAVRGDVQKLLGAPQWYPCNPGNASYHESTLTAGSLTADALLPSTSVRDPAVVEDAKSRRSRVCQKIGSWHEQVDSQNRAPSRIPTFPPPLALQSYKLNAQLSRKRAVMLRYPDLAAEPLQSIVDPPPRASTPCVPPRASTPCVGAAPAKDFLQQPQPAAPTETSAPATAEDWLPTAIAPRDAVIAETVNPGEKGSAPAQAMRWNRWKALHQCAIPGLYDQDTTAVSVEPNPIVPVRTAVPRQLHAKLTAKLAEMRKVGILGAGKVPGSIGDKPLPIQAVKHKKGKAGVLSKLLLRRVRQGNLSAEPPREAFFQAW
jgi:hypothetical protein